MKSITDDMPTALDLPCPPEQQLPETLASYFAKCQEKLGLVPNVLRTYSHNPEQHSAFAQFYNQLMLADSELTKTEREMIAVVVSAENRCWYCQVAHGAALKQMSDVPHLTEQLQLNHKVAHVSERERAMLDFAIKLTDTPNGIEESDRAALRQAGFSDSGIWDIANIVGFYNMTNRIASATAMLPNEEYLQAGN